MGPRRGCEMSRTAPTLVATPMPESGAVLAAIYRLVLRHQGVDVQAGVHVADFAGQKSVGDPFAVAVGGQKGAEARLGQWGGPGFAQMVRVAFAQVGAGVFAQDQAGPVERALQYERSLCALALGLFNGHRLPLLPQAGRSQRRHQRDGEHGQQQGAALLCVEGVRAVHERAGINRGCTQSRCNWP